jgi:hypothetical protein
MTIYIGTIVFLAIIIIIFILIAVNKYITTGNKAEDYLQNSVNLIIIFTASAGIYGYYLQYNNSVIETKDKYAQVIIEQFNLIDDSFITHYDELKPIFDLMYNKVSMPSSDTLHVPFLFDNVPNKTKDFTFILFNKITYLLEKIYNTDPSLFKNDRLGMKIKLYIKISPYYEYWRINNIIYNNEFVLFMEKTYDFLTINNGTFVKPDIYSDIIPYTTNKNFLQNNI